MSRIRANTITNQNANGAPNFPDGITVTGVVTATTTSQNITGDLTVSGNVGVGGTLTYEDVTNVDSIGVITARSSINVNAASSGIGVTINSGGINVAGVITATSFSGIDSDKISEGNTEVETIDTGSDGHVKFSTEGGERLRIGPAGQIGIAGANYGTSGQVLTSQGSGSPIQWATVSTPLVAYKAKEFARQRYTYSGSSWHEIETNFRISHTPAAVGNTIICAVQIYLVIGENTYGGLTIVSDQGSGSNEAMLGETNTSGGVAKGSILGGNYANEQMRQSGGTTWLGQHLWGYHVTENTNSHTFKLFGRMGSGTRSIGDNQLAQFMQMWEYSGNVVSSTIS